MECTLATLVACFSWSNFYVDGGLAYHDAGVYQQYERFSAERTIIDGVVRSSGLSEQRWQTHRADNPYGRVTLGYELSFGALSWRVEAFHFSSLAGTLDRGVNGISLSARWYPFRQ